MGQAQDSQSHETPVYAEDGVTVIAVKVGKESTADPSLPPQRWFDGPGPQYRREAPPAQLGRRSSELAAQTTATQPAATAPTEPSERQLMVRNKVPRPLSVSCGGSAVLVPGGRTLGIPVNSTSVHVMEVGASEAACEVSGLPDDPTRTVVVLREVGGVACASLEYAPPRETMVSREALMEAKGPDPAAAKADEAEDDEPPPVSPRTQKLEQRLMEAMQRGDEQEVRNLLDQMQ
eukprot:gnl/TRDRNA2_/TRDRNA2_197281_c0_seq1.p2 gnl/TRDRNA2_/TRDRNA2_197281_c0~~gnl/TRDRNA2_/TRDRNA2_197281_c0_seq1.p2  ORF type:complete len:234 (-),score=46.17 gnl/TRDRNA2_/TRDRNA2_197281_c0_seq1:156-857(-)